MFYVPLEYFVFLKSSDSCSNTFRVSGVFSRSSLPETQRGQKEDKTEMKEEAKRLYRDVKMDEKQRK